jgi:5-(carboxyamino)imidazole ribonucleotide synthase
MLIEESLRLNFTFNVLDSDKECPCSQLASTFIHGSLMDDEKIAGLAEISDVLTYEIEHVNTDALVRLERSGCQVIPPPAILRIIQDKGLQKQFYESHEIPTAPFALVNNPSDWAAAVKKLGAPKFVAKTRTEGYDGRGVSILEAATILDGSVQIPFSTPCMLEEFIECEKEISVIVARDPAGKMVCYSPVEMEFDPVANLVTLLVCPAAISDQLVEKTRQVALDVVKAFAGAGLFAVEMFVDRNGSVFVNEVAPRPHNSGHHTIEAAFTSQYEQFARILSGLPLGDPGLIQPAVMLNLLGPSHFTGRYKLLGLEAVSAIAGVYVHLYGKPVCKPMRKMGHVTVLGETPHEAHAKADFVRQSLRFEMDE